MKNKLIYIVDDSIIIQELLSLTFAQLDHVEVKKFSTGEDMVSAIGDEEPDLFILDYFLDSKDADVYNGRDLINILKNQHKKGKIIMLSSLEDKVEIESLICLGVEKFIDKNIGNVVDGVKTEALRLLQAV